MCSLGDMKTSIITRIEQNQLNFPEIHGAHINNILRTLDMTLHALKVVAQVL